MHASSRSSSQPVLARTNYVLIQGDDFLAVDMRPHGLVELVFCVFCLVVFGSMFCFSGFGSGVLHVQQASL